MSTPERSDSPDYSKRTKDDSPTKEAVHFLLFKLAGELYGCPLLQVREVVKVPSIKAIPLNQRYLKGVINLRGRVISVMDLSQRLGLKHQEPSATLMFVVESKEIRLGVLIDSAESVVELRDSDIDNPLNVNSIPKKFFLGVAKVQDRLINLVDLDAFANELDTSVEDAGDQSAN